MPDACLHCVRNFRDSKPKTLHLPIYKFCKTPNISSGRNVKCQTTGENSVAMETHIMRHICMKLLVTCLGYINVTLCIVSSMYTCIIGMAGIGTIPYPWKEKENSYKR